MMGQEVVLFRDAHYHYLDVEDFCAIMQRLIDEDIFDGEYNVTPDQGTYLHEIIEMVDRTMAINAPYRIISSGFGRPYTANNQRIHARLPGLRFTPLEASIQRLVQHYQGMMGNLDRQTLMEDPLLHHAKQINQA